METSRAADAPEAVVTAAPATASEVPPASGPPPSPPLLSPLRAAPSPGAVSTLASAPPPPLPPAPVVPTAKPEAAAAAAAAAASPVPRRTVWSAAHYLAPTAATTARRRTPTGAREGQSTRTVTTTSDARPHRTSSSSAAAAATAVSPPALHHARPVAARRPSAPRRSTPRASRVAAPPPPPHVAFIDAVLDAQFTAADASAAAPRLSEPALLHVTEATAPRRGLRGRSRRLAPPAQRSAPTTTPMPPLHATGAAEADDEDDDGMSDADGTAHAAPLRLQPLAPSGASATAALVEEALALGAGPEDGADGHPETFADVHIEPTLVPPPPRWHPSRTTAAAPLLAHSAAQSTLAAERAALLEDSPDRAVEGRGGIAGDAEASQARIWGPTTAEAAAGTAGGSPTPALPTAIVEFLRAEAAAEAAVRSAQTAARPPVAAAATAARTPGGTSPPSPPQHAHERRRPPAPPPPPPPLSPSPTSSVSPAAESAAVLRELQDVQRRLHAHGGRRAETTTATPAKAAESVSPCDVSTSASDMSSTTSSTGDRRASGVGVMGRRGRDPEHWTTASITEIVDAIDGRSAALRQRSRSPARGTAHTTSLPAPRHPRRDVHRRGAAGVKADFDPEVYAHRLLHATGPHGVGGDDGSSNSEMNDELAMWDADELEALGVDVNAGEHQRHADGDNDPHRLTQLSFAQHRRDALLRAGPTWATAAAEMGLTPREVQELLHYSVSYTGGPAAGPASFDVDAGATHARAPSVEKLRGGGDPRVPAPDAAAAPERRAAQAGIAAGTLADTAVQSALVQRIVAALPAVPPALEAELDRQRRLLERVCRDVRVMSAPAHAAVRARLSAPTVASAASRQPSPVEFYTSARPGDAHGSDGAPHAEAHEAADDAAAQRLLLASVPRPAARALRAMSGLHRSAADPAAPLPPFHALVAPPQPYEAALHELAERETRHYAAELDRLRTSYDRQLQEERRQRQQEQRQYAELLQTQQQRLLRHHRETVHLLQRETRLQEGQRAALVQQLAVSQAAAAQRQQVEHEHATKHMLAGAVDVVKSYVAAAAEAQQQRAVQADRAWARQQNEQQRQQQSGKRPLRAALPPKVSHRGERSKGTQRHSTHAAAPRTASPPAPPADAGTGTAAGVPPTKRTKMERRDATSTPSNPAPTADTAYREDVDADIPTAGHLTPLRRLQTTRPSSPSTDAGAATPAATAVSPASSAASHHSTAEKTSRHSVGERDTAEEEGSPAAAARSTMRPAPAASAGPAINTSAALRAVYGASAAASTRHVSPPPRRMTLPLRVRLPPEEVDDGDVPRRTRAAMAAELRDVRAVAAAREAGLVDGTRLYGVPERRRAGRGTAATQAVQARDAHADRRAAPALRRRVSRHAPSAPARTSRSAEAPTGRGRGGAGRGGRRSRSAPSLSLPLPHQQTQSAHRHHFDIETISLLSSDAGGAASIAAAAAAAQAPHAAFAYPPSVNPHAAIAVHDGSPPATTGPAAAQYAGAWSELIAHAAHHHGVLGGAVSAGAAPPPLIAGASVAAPLAEAATVAQRPAVGRAVIVLSPPIRDTVTTAAVHAPDADAAQLTAALQHRAAVIETLRREAAAAVGGDVDAGVKSAAMDVRQRTAAGAAAAVSGRGDADDGCGAAVTVRRAVGALPPCDAAFFGAPAEVLGYGDAATDATEAGVPWTLLTDYARAWARVAAAERAVERHAEALAAEDVGVLEAVAGPAGAVRPSHDTAGTSTAASEASGVRALVPMPRPASTAAAVQYREQQLTSDASAGGFHVSPRMAAEARALAEARQRLAHIQRCFITPSSLLTRGHVQGGGGDVDTTAAAVQRAEVLRQLVHATAVESVLEAHGADPMQHFMKAMEDEMLRVMLATRLDAAPTLAEHEAQARRPAATPSVTHVDAELAQALAEATLQDAVYAALAQAHVATAAETSPAQRERVPLPTVAATAWLEDAVETDDAAAVAGTQGVPQPEDASGHVTADDTLGKETATALTRQPPAVDGPGEDIASTAANAATATATVRVPLQPRVQTADGAPWTQEVRVVVDLSPAMQHMVSGLRPDAEGAGQRTRRYPPMQQEQLPGPWLAMEDGRDVVVQVERRPPAEASTSAPTQPVPGAPEPDDTAKSTTQESAEIRAEAAAGMPAPPAVLPLPQIPADAAGPPTLHSPALSVPPPPPPHPPLLSSGVPGSVVRVPAAPLNVVDVADAPDVTPPPPGTPAAPAPAFPSVLFQLLRSGLCDQEQQQRAGLADREEEQRYAVVRLRGVARDVVDHRSAAVPPVSPAAAPVAVHAPSPSRAPSGMAAPPPPPPQPLSPQAAPSSHAASSRGSAAAAAVSSAPPPPPVRDPVMGFVLDWVRQFGGAAPSQGRPARSRSGRSSAAASAAMMMEGLTAAAQTAASMPEPQVEVALAITAPSPDPRLRYAASGPSTRNLGTSTSSAASSSSAVSPSLPSSLHTASSSDTTPSALRFGVAPAEPGAAPAADVYRHAPTRKSRPVLDAQQHRRRGSHDGDGSTTASTATTRYTSLDAPSLSRARDDTPATDAGAGYAAAGPAGAADAPSRLLPPRASEEVQAALAAALRAHQRMADLEQGTAAAGPPDAAARLVMPDVSFGSAMGNSSYAVTLPAASAETTAVAHSPYRGASARQDRPTSQRPAVVAAVHDEEGASTPPYASKPATEATRPSPPAQRGALVPARSSAPAPAAAAAAWGELSLTSTSTSSRSGVTQHWASAHPPQPPPAAATMATTTTTSATRTSPAAPPSFPLPFQTASAAADDRVGRARGDATVAVAPAAVTQATATAPPHAFSQVLQAQVQRIQQEQRARVPW